MAPTVYIMVGLPGSGKSTLVDNVLRDVSERVFVYSTDKLIEEWATAQGWTYDFAFSKYIKKATAEMNSRLRSAIETDQDVIWDQTNMGARKRQTILSNFPKHYRRECRVIEPPIGDSQIEDWLWRLKNRPGKTIPDHIIESMRDSYVEPALSEGFDRVVKYNMYGMETWEIST
jgi:tRNA uridine 5-carbamoylmethylation protein Kti12